MRYYDWPERLFDVIKTAQSSKFEWGTNDCALFACDCANAVIGVDHAKSFRGKYKTRKGAMSALKKIEGVDSISKLADKYLGDRIELSIAQRGDVVLLTVESIESLGVVAGSYAVFLSPDGIQTVPLAKCVCAWRVN